MGVGSREHDDDGEITTKGTKVHEERTGALRETARLDDGARQVDWEAADVCIRRG